MVVLCVICYCYMFLVFFSSASIFLLSISQMGSDGTRTCDDYVCFFPILPSRGIQQTRKREQTSTASTSTTMTTTITTTCIIIVHEQPAEDVSGNKHDAGSSGCAGVSHPTPSLGSLRRRPRLRWRCWWQLLLYYCSFILPLVPSDPATSNVFSFFFLLLILINIKSLTWMLLLFHFRQSLPFVERASMNSSTRKAEVVKISDFIRSKFSRRQRRRKKQERKSHITW